MVSFNCIKDRKRQYYGIYEEPNLQKETELSLSQKALNGKEQ
jgi:hypothetical protein